MSAAIISAAREARGAELRDRLLAVPSVEREAFTNALLGIADAAEDEPNLPRGSVPYLPCGVDEILAMVNDVPLRREDVFVDLGSGLGRVAILAHLLSGARALGLEIQETLVRSANASAFALGLEGVSFLHANAAEAELDGSVFFLYAPFNGDMLNAVIRKMEDVARRRSLVVCAVGLELRDIPWLVPRKTSVLSLTLYDSRAPEYARTLDR